MRYGASGNVRRVGPSDDLQNLFRFSIVTGASARPRYSKEDFIEFDIIASKWPAAGFVDGTLSFHSSLLECD
ncbi:hypothetical protein, partial [Cognatiyoonia sp. IB215182]|uniref:hypothetical protein n=1 Tax=Cognatiyoonia sp. IB215182 TaxID=3097353 RepID=UPI002A108B18